MIHNSPDMIGPEGNLQLSQDLGGFLHASLKLTTYRQLLLEYFVKKSRTTMKNCSSSSVSAQNSHFNL